MKKIILLFIATFFMVSYSHSQMVNIKLANWSFDTVGIWKFDVQAVIPSGQTWRVGSCNIRVDFVTQPAGKLVVRQDSVTNGGVRGVNSNLNNNANYGFMTTTSINGGTAISMNINHTPGSACYHMTSGNTYTIGRIRFYREDTCQTCDTIRHSGPGVSPLYDSLTLLTTAQWGAIDPVPACVPVSINNNGIELPTAFKLYNNYPNPFNPSTTIKYDVPKSAFVKIVIYDMLGKDVATLVNEKKDAGSYEIMWNAMNYASGTYFYKMETDAYTDVKKMILIK